jgi:threonine dehydrogenase-like Zn-dependent dehydrogenase
VDSPAWDSPTKPGESILGHEWVGEVVEIGDGVEGWKKGDRAVDLKAACGNCYWCRRQMPHLCMGGRVRGTPFESGGWANMYGAMQEYIIRGARGLQKVPDSVTDEEAALTEPLNVGLSPVYDAGVKAGDSVAILGAGHIGQLTLLAAKAAGAAPVIITDRIQSRLDKALEMGADYALMANDDRVYSQMQDITEAGPDNVFICVREADVLRQAASAARREGTVAIIGFPKPAEINPIYWLTKHLRIIGCDPMLKYNMQALKLMQYKRVDARKLVSAVMPLKDVKEAFESLYNGKNILVELAP